MGHWRPAALLDEVRRVAGIRKLAQLPKPQVEVLDTLIRSGYRIQKLLIRPEEGISLPALWFLPDRPKMGPAVLYLHEQGKAADAGPGGPIEQQYRPDKRFWRWISAARARPGRPRRAGIHPRLMTTMWPTCWDVPVWGCARRHFDLRPLCGRAPARQLVAIGNVGVPALHAAAVEADLFQSVTLSRTLVSWSNVIHSRLQQRPAVDLVHGALVYYDLPNLAATLGDKLKMGQPVDARGTIVQPFK